MGQSGKVITRSFIFFYKKIFRLVHSLQLLVDYRLNSSPCWGKKNVMQWSLQFIRSTKQKLYPSIWGHYSYDGLHDIRVFLAWDISEFRKIFKHTFQVFFLGYEIIGKIISEVLFHASTGESSAKILLATKREKCEIHRRRAKCVMKSKKSIRRTFSGVLLIFFVFILL